MSAIAAGLEIAASLVPAGTGGTANVTVDDLVPILEDIAYRFSVVADVFNAADSAATASVTAGTEAATQIEVIGQNVKDITEHTYTVVIPHSLSWLAGYIVSHFITPIEERLTKDESNIAFLLGWRGQIDTWRRDFVDPNVEKWVGWKQWFDGWPQSVVFTVKSWLDNPDVFAQWAAAPLIGPLVSYLAAPEHKTTRDNLTLIIADAWTEDTNLVWEAVLRLMVANK